MTDGNGEARCVRASGTFNASAQAIFELIADPAEQPRWDGNGNLRSAEPGQRVRAVGEVFAMTITSGAVRENHVVEFTEGRTIAWCPADPGAQPAGHLWRWEVEPIDEGRARVTHTYDWSRLTDDNRVPRARATTSEKLQTSVDRLGRLAEGR